jgi:hypothetical protein
LNLSIFFMYSTASSAGYIGSLVNSLLVLPECRYTLISRQYQNTDRINRSWRDS